MNHSEIVNFIPEKIKAIEKKEHIKILYAAESGSRSCKFQLPIVIMIFDSYTLEGLKTIFDLISFMMFWNSPLKKIGI